MLVPGLHVVTDDEVLGAGGFSARASRLMERHGPAVALHLRGPRTSPSRLLELAGILSPVAAGSGARLLINDRVDVALAADVDGVQLGQRSLPVPAVRPLRPDWLIGASVHDAAEAVAAERADFLVVGTVWPSASHPEREGGGLPLLRSVRDRVRLPVMVIGGVTPQRALDARAAGAAGVAVLRGVWGAEDPARAAGLYLDSMTEAGDGG